MMHPLGLGWNEFHPTLRTSPRRRLLRHRAQNLAQPRKAVVAAARRGLAADEGVELGDLYRVLPFGVMPVAGDLASWTVARMAEVFSLGLSLALPFVAIGFAYNLALGAFSRAMPQLLVALVGVPLLIGLGLGVLWLSLPEIFARWDGALVAVMANPLGGFR